MDCRWPTRDRLWRAARTGCMVAAATLLAGLLGPTSAGAHCCVCFDCVVEGMCTDEVADTAACEQLCVQADCPRVYFETESDCLAGCTVGSGVPGDCDADGQVTVSELVKGVGIALGQADLAECQFFDTNHDQMVTVGELIAAVNAALG